MVLLRFDQQQRVLRRQKKRAREVLSTLVADANWDPNAVESLLRHIFGAAPVLDSTRAIRRRRPPVNSNTGVN